MGHVLFLKQGFNFATSAIYLVIGFIVAISFHSVLKQPQSDQAVSGITALLQQELRDVELDLVPESKRSKNIPLLVVLYNLSRLMDDVRGALSGVEGLHV